MRKGKSMFSYLRHFWGWGAQFMFIYTIVIFGPCGIIRSLGIADWPPELCVPFSKLFILSKLLFLYR